MTDVQKHAPSACNTPKPTISQTTVGGLLGELVWLMTQSPAHRHLFLGDLEWLLIPAILTKQIRTFHHDGRIIGAAMWASVSEEVEKERFCAGIMRLAPGEWKCGDRVWLIDLIAPFGGSEAMLDALTQSNLANVEFKYVSRSPDGECSVKTALGKSTSPDESMHANNTDE